MTLDNIGYTKAAQVNKATKSNQVNQQNMNAQADKLFSSHNLMLTRILQNGLNIPQELLEKIKRQAPLLKKLYFGLDNYLLDPHLLPKDQGEFVVMYTQSLPVVVPKIFFEEENNDQIMSKDLVINLVDEKKWSETDPDTLLFPEFLKAGLVFFSERNFIKKEKIKMIQTTANPFLPEHSVIFSMKCNFFTLLLFFYNNQQYFHNLQTGLQNFLKFVNRSK